MVSEAVWHRLFLNNSLETWGLAFLVAAGVGFLLNRAKRLIVKRLRLISAKTDTEIDDMIVDMLAHTRPLFLILISAYAGAQVLTLPPGLARLVSSAAIVAVLLQVAFWGNAAISFWLPRLSERTLVRKETSPSPFGPMIFTARTLLWSVILLLTLDNLGFDITTLIAGLGVGGVAIALATQNILGDLFCSISIMLDRPFEPGDAILVGDQTGTVERIGIKTTRVRSVQGEEIIYSNADLLGSRIRNFKSMKERRVVFSVGVVYRTPADKLEAIPGMIREIIGIREGVRFDRAHFKSFGDSALVFEIVYYVLAADYLAYMDQQQAINLAIARQFEREGIEFAYPTQTLYVHAVREGA